jgi:hypothetical protein
MAGIGSLARGLSLPYRLAFEFRYPMPAEADAPLPSVGEVTAVLDQLRDFRAAVGSALASRA